MNSALLFEYTCFLRLLPADVIFETIEWHGNKIFLVIASQQIEPKTQYFDFTTSEIERLVLLKFTNTDDDGFNWFEIKID